MSTILYNFTLSISVSFSNKNVLLIYTLLPLPQQVEETKENKEEAQKEAEEGTEEVFQMLDRKNKKSLRYKRSFFVRMVSDPKIYNPKIVRSLPRKSCKLKTFESLTIEDNG